MKIENNNNKIGEYIVTGYSRGLLSSWMGFPQFGILFDVGDGASVELNSTVGTYKHLAITHAHMDHISGLASFVNLRHRLNPSLKTEIHYPLQAQNRLGIQLSMVGDRRVKSIELDPINALECKNKSIDIGGRRKLKPFPTNHCGSGCNSSVGYLITETRKYRKREYDSLSQEEMRNMSERGIDISEERDYPLVAYVGDSPKLNDEQISFLNGVELLVLESTMVNKSDFEEPEALSHSSIEESLQAASKIKPKHLILNHVSPRYHDAFVTHLMENESTKIFGSEYPFTIHRLLGSQFFKLRNE